MGLFEGKVGINGNIPELTYLWVNDVFHWKYIIWVKTKSNIWHDVPVGVSRGNDDLLPKWGPKNWSPPIHYYPQMWLKQDKGQDVCAHASIVSALFHAGDNETAEKLRERVSTGKGLILNDKH